MSTRSKRLIRNLTILIVTLVATAFLVSGAHIEFISKL